MPGVQKQMTPKVDKINSFESPNKRIALRSLHFKTENKEQWTSSKGEESGFSSGIIIHK